MDKKTNTNNTKIDNKKTNKKKNFKKNINNEDNNNQNNIKRLYRSQEDSMIGGVAGGISEHLQVDPVWIRLLFVISIFFDGIGILVYLILWIVIPENPSHKNKNQNNLEEKKEEIVENIENNNNKQINKKQNSQSRILIGTLMIFIGVIFLFQEYLKLLQWKVIFSLLIISLGIILLMKKN